MVIKTGYKKTTLLSVLFAGTLIGLALARTTDLLITDYVCPFLTVFAVTVYRKRNLVSLVAMLVLGVSLGIWRGHIFARTLLPYQELSTSKVVVVGTADSSAVYGQNAQLEFDLAHLKVVEPISANLPGRMAISGYGENSVLKGDVVQIEGKMYLRRGSKQAGISYAQLKVLSRSSSVVEKIRRDFLAGLATALPEPHDQFAAGLLIGQRSELQDSIVQTLRIVGLSHVIAVSGYNLTILADVARKRFGKKSKFRSSLISISFILLFLGLAGSSASIARAAFVSILTITSAHFGRQIKPLLLILFAASYTALVNPLNVWTDIGWYLSFLAFFGVLVLAPTLNSRIFKNSKKPNPIAALVIETSCAQIMTVPLVMYIFGEVSIISLVANLLVVPFVPIAMLLSLIAGLAGMFWPFASGIFAYPARILLGFMLQVSSLLAKTPHALAQAKIGSVIMIAMYLLIIFLVLIIRQKAAKYAKISEAD